jgi:hypothetical protein
MKIERLLFHRKAAKNAEMIDLFFFAVDPELNRLPHVTGQGRRQRKMLMCFPPGWKRGRISSIQRSYAKRAVFPFSVIPVPWNVYPVKCKAYFSGTKPIPLGSAEKGENYLLGDLLALLNIGKSGLMTYSQHSF